jgi:cytochrome c-type biogenesis protein CcmH/NrfG
MSDPHPADAASLEDVAGAERDARVEQLLLTGLDHYFAAEYAQAIDVWTRVLFFDRSHARARAYIERARNAQAERQRECEELLHKGVTAFQRGDYAAARRLLDDVLALGGPQDLALPLLERLDRLERAKPSIAPPVPAPVPPRPGRRSPAVTPRSAPAARRFRWAPVLALVAAMALGAAAAASWRQIEAWVFPSSAPLAISSEVDEPPPFPHGSEAVLTRARELQDRGALAEALAALDAVGVADALRPDVDRLRAELQRSILQAAPASPSPPSPESRR